MELKIVKDTLSFAEYKGFIECVVDSVFVINDEGTLEYVPENYDLFLRLAFVSYYSDYKPKDEDIKKTYNEIGFINLYEYDINKTQLKSIESAILNKIDFLKQQLLNQSKKDSLSELLDSITSFVKTMENKFADVDMSNIDGLAELGKKVGSLSDTKLVNALVKEISKSKNEK